MHPLQIFCKSQALSETYDYGFITLITLENVRKNICCQRNQSFNFFNFNLTSVGVFFNQSFSIKLRKLVQSTLVLSTAFDHLPCLNTKRVEILNQDVVCFGSALKQRIEVLLFFLEVVIDW